MKDYKHCAYVRLCQNCLERAECLIEYPWNAWSAYLSANTASNNAPAQNRVWMAMQDLYALLAIVSPADVLHWYK